MEKAELFIPIKKATINDRDADALIGILSGQRSELWMQAATSLSLIATERHLKPLGKQM
jgi:hypothetical protein